MSNLAKLRLLLALALLTWAGLALIVTQASPDNALSRILFFVLLYLALSSSLTLVAYFLSFRLFASKAYRGNLLRSLQQGALWAAFFVAAAAMQVARTLSLLTGAILLAFFGLAGAIALTRK